MKQPLNASYPVLPLRDIVVFPHMIVPLFVGREKSVRAREEVMNDDKQILLASQIDPSEDDPTSKGIYKAGVLANVLQLLKLPDGTVKVLVEGQTRVRITQYLENENFFEASCEHLTEMPGDPTAIEALLRTVAEEFERYAKVKKNIPEEALSAVGEATEPAMLADLVHGKAAVSDRALLANVVKHKKVFYNASYANYDACLTGQLRLIPEDVALAALRDDFQRMIGAGMFIGEPPAFDAIVDRLREPVRLAAGLREDGTLDEETVERALECLGRLQSSRDPTCRSDVVFFDQDAIPQGHALVLATTHTNGILLRLTQTRQSLACVEHMTASGIGARAFDGPSILTRERGHG
jgi:Lon protease-like protein